MGTSSANLSQNMGPESSAGIAQLLRENPVFTRLWLAQVFSQVGDWLSYVALLSLIVQLTGSGMHVAFVLLSASLPSLLMAPWAGSVADKYDRRLVMMGMDLLRAVLVLGFLFVNSLQLVWLAYVLVVLGVVANSFFSPCANAAVPNLVKKEHLTAANSLVNASGGVITAGAAWAGGLVAAYLGREAAFGLDSLTFLVSAAVLFSVKVPFSATSEKPLPNLEQSDASRSMVGQFWEACQYLPRHIVTASIVALKVGVGLGGGLLVLLSVVPVKVFEAGDLGVGIMYGCRGLGTVIGALLAGWSQGLTVPKRLHLAGWCLVVCGAFSIAFGWCPGLIWAALCVLLAFVGYGICLVISATLLQATTEDSFLGRISALDNACMTSASTVSTVACGLALGYWSPGWVTLGLGILMIVAILVWMVRFSRPLSNLLDQVPAADGSPALD